MSDTYVQRRGSRAIGARPVAEVRAASKGKLKDCLDWRAVGAAAAIGALGVAFYFHRYEGGATNLYFVWSATLLLAATIVFLTRRVLPAAVLIPAMVAVVDQASVVKHKAMNLVVHAYDLFFYLSSFATLHFLWSEYRLPLIGLILALLATVTLSVLSLSEPIPAPENCGSPACKPPPMVADEPLASYSALF